MNAKDRRHSGWITPNWGAHGKYSEEIEEGNEPKIYWNDWLERRDGYRYDPDSTHLRSVRNGHNNSFEEKIVEANARLKKLLLRRKAQKKNDNNITRMV